MTNFYYQKSLLIFTIRKDPHLVPLFFFSPSICFLLKQDTRMHLGRLIATYSSATFPQLHQLLPWLFNTFYSFFQKNNTNQYSLLLFKHSYHSVVSLSKESHCILRFHQLGLSLLYNRAHQPCVYHSPSCVPDNLRQNLSILLPQTEVSVVKFNYQRCPTYDS